MSAWQLERPGPSEYAPFAEAYVASVPGEFLNSQLLASQPAYTLLQSVAEDRASNHVYAPGKWTIKEIVGHLSDAERIFSYRALRIARGDATPLPGFEQDDYVRLAHMDRRTLASLLDEFRTIRQATLALFDSFSPEVWMRRGQASGFSLTVRGIAFTLAGHELHHVNILRERYLV